MRGDLHYTLTRVENVLAELRAMARCELAPRYNIAPGQYAPVAVLEAGARLCKQLRWGLLPRRRGRSGKRGPLVSSAPIEAIPTAPLLRDAFRKQRCLVVADGCFAWSELKQPIWFHPEPRRPVAFAGVWAINDDDGEPSFALLLGPPLVTRVNDPMPIVVPPEAYGAWLDPTADVQVVSELLVRPALTGWRADAVSTRMRSSVDDPACIEPIGTPGQTELF